MWGRATGARGSDALCLSSCAVVEVRVKMESVA